MTRGTLVTAFMAELALNVPQDAPKNSRDRQKAAAAAAAYAIWADNELHGWDRTLTEVAYTTGFTPERVMRIYSVKNWTRHMRQAPRNFHPGHNLIVRTDTALTDLDHDMPMDDVA